MLDTKVKIKVGADFEPLPADKYTCQIVDVTLVEQFNKFKGENQEMLNYKFVVLDDNKIEKIPTPETTRGRYLWKRCSMTMSPKSWLYKLAKAIHGKELTKKEQMEFDPNSIVGKQVDVMTEQAVGADGLTVYSNIVSFATNKKPLKPVELETTPAGKDTESRSAFAAPKLPGNEALSGFEGKTDEEIKNMKIEDVLAE